jgi:hypothetical protein
MTRWTEMALAELAEWDADVAAVLRSLVHRWRREGYWGDVLDYLLDAAEDSLLRYREEWDGRGSRRGYLYQRVGWALAEARRVDGRRERNTRTLLEDPDRRRGAGRPARAAGDVAAERDAVQVLKGKVAQAVASRRLDAVAAERVVDAVAGGWTWRDAVGAEGLSGFAVRGVTARVRAALGGGWR